ncbi:hypothetical protein EDB92DRAFT_1954217 [Lactarius akahatsu]|uniref:Uncharacterized protein n=1 Tax=Lactarius akahatsu TaxID=416441 RepID=A0AAD4L6H8_9AGAM|nr:hypothetical protein EDB92DRAFT_1954217 [Lactarius akahatsu]
MAKQKASQSQRGWRWDICGSDPVQWTPSPHPAFMSLLQSGAASQSTPSAEAAPSKMLRSKQDNATSHAKVPSTRAAKAKGNRATVTDDNDVAAQPVSGSRSVTPIKDPECQSPRWGAQVQVRLATSSFENLSEPAPPMMIHSKQDLTTSRTKAPSTRAATKAKANGAAVIDGDSDVAAQPVSGSHSVTPIEDPRCQSPRWGAQVQVRLATSSFENLSKPAPPKTTRSKQDHTTSSAKAPLTWVAKAKDSCSVTDDNAAAQSKPKSRLVTPAEDPGHESPDQARMAPSSSEHLDDDNGLHSHLQVLLHDKLRCWVDEHKIESQGKWLTRTDLIKVITGAPKSEQPSKEDIKSIINEAQHEGCIAATFIIFTHALGTVGSRGLF